MTKIDFDPNTQDALMPADTAMRFMTWASYYNGIDLTLGKPCPFTEESLHLLFGTAQK